MEKEKIERKEAKEEHGGGLDEEDGLRDMIGAYVGQVREVVTSWVGMGVLGEKDGQRGQKEKEEEEEVEVVELPVLSIPLLYNEASPPDKPRREQTKRVRTIGMTTVNPHHEQKPSKSPFILPTKHFDPQQHFMTEHSPLQRSDSHKQNQFPPSNPHKPYYKHAAHVHTHAHKSTNQVNNCHPLPEKSYNPITDKSLVQYFYPKQSTFRQKPPSAARNKTQPREPVIPNKGIFKKLSEKGGQNLIKFGQQRPENGYLIQKECRRTFNFNDYDLLSCERSLSPLRNKKRTTRNLTERVSRPRQQMKSSEAVTLRRRMVNLESRVINKLPFLIRMGINFKKHTQ